jgi:hypothetical protein
MKSWNQSERVQECGGETAEAEVPRIQLYRRTRDQASNCAKILGSFQAASSRDYTVPILEPITSTFLFARYSSMSPVQFLLPTFFKKYSTGQGSRHHVHSPGPSNYL